MRRFFQDFESIDSFTLSLDYHQDKVECPHCLKNDQFVSHGIIYKQRSIAVREAVGKRIFCSNRYGRKGCGRTLQLYMAQAIPAMQYGAAHLFVFLSSLLVNLTVDAAYRQATGQSTSRHAWRWLTKLAHRLSDFRSLLNARLDTLATGFNERCRRLKLLLPTVKRLFSILPHCPCAHYQLGCQHALI